tara:strand:- start:134 stop:304 length:171 start_codon:yes stop_codon:yes gene_type:complete
LINHAFIVAFGEMELSGLTYWSIIITGILFIVCFGLASIPLAKNIQNTKKSSQDKQ